MRHNTYIATEAEVQPLSNRQKWTTCVHSINFFLL